MHLVDVEVEDVVGALEEAVLGHHGADLAHLVEEQRRAPVLDEELVPLGVREDVAAEAEHLLERLRSSGVASSCEYSLGDAVALGEQPVLRAVEARARADLRDVAGDRGEREPQVVDPGAVVVVEAVAGRHEEPRVLARLELGDPGAPASLCPRVRRAPRRGVRPSANEPSTPCSSADRGERLELVVGAEHRRVVARDHLRHHLHAHVREGLLAELEERQVRAVREQQQLEVQLVELVVEPDAAVVGRHQAEVRAELVVVQQLLLVLELGQARHLERRELLDPPCRPRPASGRRACPSCRSRSRCAAGRRRAASRSRPGR